MSCIVRTKTGTRRLVVASKAGCGVGKSLPKHNLQSFALVGSRKRNSGSRNSHAHYTKPYVEPTKEGSKEVREAHRKAHLHTKARIPGVKRSESIVRKDSPSLRYVLIVQDSTIDTDETRDALNYCALNGIRPTIVAVNSINLVQELTDVIKTREAHPLCVHIVLDGDSNSGVIDNVHQLLLKRLNGDVRVLVVCSNPFLVTTKRHHFRAPHVRRSSLSLPLSVEQSDHPSAVGVIDAINAAL